ncbi:MAG: DUF190 domain-containing protein [Kouleothrix sp.]|nr:DUF190 domain-containing protein [Kouleothrix sp.]
MFQNETDQWQHQPLYLAVLDHLRRVGIANATILRDTTGAGVPQPIQQPSHSELSGERGVAVTFVDRPERVTWIMAQLLSWLCWLTALAEDGVITVAPIMVVAVSQRMAKGNPTRRDRIRHHTPRCSIVTTGHVNTRDYSVLSDPALRSVASG